MAEVLRRVGGAAEPGAGEGGWPQWRSTPAPNSPFKVACYYPEEAMYNEKGNLISLYHNYGRRVSWSPELVRKTAAGAY